MVLQMSQKQILIKLMTAIPRFQWNTQRKAFGTNAQPRIARYGSSRGLGTSPTEKNTDVARKAAPVFLPLYIQRPCSPICAILRLCYSGLVIERKQTT